MDWKPSSTYSPLRSPGSPLSPTFGNMSREISYKLRNRIPSQMRRTFPLYILSIIIFILVLKSQVFPSRPSTSPVMKRTSFQKIPFSPQSTGTFPKKIWQTWKVDPFHFEPRDFDTAKTWTTKNPNHRYEVLTGGNNMLYVEDRYDPNGFINRPDIVEFYRSVTTTIVKADLLRYMVMYADGGVYADIDVEALKSVDRFIPARYSAEEIDMVIGIEIDQPEFKDHPILAQKSMSFCPWTVMCKPGLPVMWQFLEDIMAWLNDVADAQNVCSVGEVKLDFDEVIIGTGPSAFTNAILEDMNNSAEAKKITWEKKFAAGQGHSGSGNHNARGTLVKHHYHASNWPSKHPRFKHPAYGECVKKWDEDVEVFKGLSREEQKKIFEEKSRLPW
ncbi:glycosyltransferase family 32 protein [Podospora fimiseda]|uniref:Glycosyltransferase family 32 protein n=1 Tax=Podospora fimiseda TaxID=252190 RepID=A0AAN7BL20_9PEZI|nr:glycosyltransferase family 32 protein [Podospora fimiseda]